jgi:hypothetical protein
LVGADVGAAVATADGELCGVGDGAGVSEGDGSGVGVGSSVGSAVCGGASVAIATGPRDCGTIVTSGAALYCAVGDAF